MELFIHLVKFFVIVGLVTFLSFNQILSGKEDLTTIKLSNSLESKYSSIEFCPDCSSKFEDEDIVSINNTETFVNILQNFGQLINKLHVHLLQAKDPNLDEYSEYINKYCSATLVEFHILSWQYNNFFSKMKRPFAKVETFSFDTPFFNYSQNALAINELFPALRSVYITEMTNEISEWVFPHLEHLSVKFSTDREQPRSGAATMMTNNHWLKSVQVKLFDRNFLKSINTLLPGLERLQLKDYVDRGGDANDIIIFDNVRNLTSDYGLPNNTRFEKLEELNIGSHPFSPYKWLHVVVESKTLKKLTVYRGYIDDTELDVLASAKLSLNELNLILGDTVELETVVKLIENRTASNKIVLFFESKDNFGLAFEKLRSVFSAEWIITKVEQEFSGISLEKLKL